jgi:methylenetetrahydrofolate reductase (NADPH)
LTSLRDALKSQDFALTAKLSMGREQNASDLLAEAELLSQSVDAIQVPDSPYARPHISSIAGAALLVTAGIDPIMHMNSRDRNRIAIQSDLLGAQALGVSNVLLMRGTSLPADHMPRTSNVFDLGAIDLIRTAAALRDSGALVDGRLPDTPKLHIGAVATAFRPVETWQPEKLLAKADAGAQFIQLQVCMNGDALRGYVARIVAAKLTWRIQVLANLAIFPSAEAAIEMKKMRPDAAIPREVIGRLEKSVDPVQEGIDICAEVLAELADMPGVAGANLATTGEPESIIAAIEKSGVRGG